MTRGILIFAASTLALCASAAEARDWREGEVRSIRVDASAFDLSTPAGIDALAQRIDRAVGRICGADRECRDEAWASTEGQVAWAIRRDEWMRRLAEDRRAELATCGRHGCGPSPVYYVPPPPPCPPSGPGAAVTIVFAAAPPMGAWRY